MKILVINGHPNPGSLCAALAASYKRGALEAGAEVEEIEIGKLDFDTNLAYGYTRRMELEPDLLEAWQKILWAEHLVWVHPVWWGGIPAVMKGFIDRLFLPGMAFKYRENSPFWDKLLKGRSARIITTLDTPGWYYRFIFGRPSINQMKNTVLGFCGISPVKITRFSPVRFATEGKRQKWTGRAYALGKGLK